MITTWNNYLNRLRPVKTIKKTFVRIQLIYQYYGNHKLKKNHK